MEEIGKQHFRMKLLEYTIVDTVSELRTLEQKWLNRENCSNLLNFKRSIKEF